MVAIGQVGHIAHVLTNKKISDKKAALKDVYLTALKTEGKIIGASAALGGAAAAGAKFSPKVAGYIQKGIDYVKNGLSKVSVNGTSLLETVQSNSLVQKVSGLPTWAKAGIAVGTAALAGILLIDNSAGASKIGAVEARHEDK